MNVFSFIAGADCAGISGRLAEAVPGFRSMVNARNYIDYPNDLEYDAEKAVRMWEAADVVYSHHGFRSIRWALRQLHVPMRPFLIHYHGASTFDPRERTRHVKELHKWPKAKGIVSTLDLAVHTGLPWLPAPYDVTALGLMRRPDPGLPIRISHAPTNRALKSTSALIRAAGQLAGEGYPVELDIIENVTWKECLKRKASADIYFDQTVLGYGCNALEAWGMGIPVVAGADDNTLGRMLDEIGELPFYLTDEKGIYSALRNLIENPELREKYADRGLRYVRNFHDYPVVAERFKQICL